jgi:hypothetical protein
MSEPITGLALLRVPFEPHHISKLPKPFSKDSPKQNCKECGGYHGMPAMHLDYVGHAALTDRLLDVDPGWSWEPLALDPNGLPAIDREGGMWIKLTVCGVTRLGYGDAQGKTGGNAMKERIGDALRNAAMRFGAALDLWHKGDLHAEEEPPKPARTKGPVIPATAKADTSGISATREATIVGAADLAIELFNEGKEVAAYEAVSGILETEEKLYLWNYLHGHSALRASLKKQAQADKTPVS